MSALKLPTRRWTRTVALRQNRSAYRYLHARPEPVGTWNLLPSGPSAVVLDRKFPDKGRYVLRCGPAARYACRDNLRLVADSPASGCLALVVCIASITNLCQSRPGLQIYTDLSWGCAFPRQTRAAPKSFGNCSSAAYLEPCIYLGSTNNNSPEGSLNNSH
jgi:hypothetical protein